MGRILSANRRLALVTVLEYGSKASLDLRLKLRSHIKTLLTSPSLFCSYFVYFEERV